MMSSMLMNEEWAEEKIERPQGGMMKMDLALRRHEGNANDKRMKMMM